MTSEPLVSITRVTDSETGNEVIGDLDYTIHCNALERWLAAGAFRRDAQTVSQRQVALAKELRDLADALESGAGPFLVTVEYAERRATDNRARVAESLRGEIRALP